MAIMESMAGADEVLAGIKRNQITGLPPKNLDVFTVKGAGSGKLKITVQASDTVVDNQLLCTVKGIAVVRKTGSAPANINDGTLVFTHTGTTAYTYEDDNLTNGTTYYYRAFAFSDHGVYNWNAENIKSGTPSAIKFWAFTQDFSNGNPDQCITYPQGYENSDFDPMLTNEGAGTATAGDWGDFLTDTLKNLPYMVKKNGEVDYALDPTDYSKKADGVTASDYNNTSYNGGAFAWLNKIYMKEEYAQNGDSRTVIFADGEYEGFTAVGFNDGEDDLEGIWLPMGYMDASSRVLVAGTTPVASKTCDQEKALLDAFDSRCRFLGGPILNVLRDLEYMLFKSTDIQAKAGHGRCSAGSQAVIANAKVDNGNVVGWKGTAAATKALNKYFHSQVLGSYQQLTRDPYTLLIGGKLYVCKDYSYALSSSGKTDTGKTWPSDSAWQYPKHLEYLGDGFGSFPKHENTGSTSTGLCDGVYGNASGTRVARRLGNCSNELSDGPACVSLDNEASGASWYCGLGCVLLPSAGYAPA